MLIIHTIFTWIFYVSVCCPLICSSLFCCCGGLFMENYLVWLVQVSTISYACIYRTLIRIKHGERERKEVVKCYWDGNFRIIIKLKKKRNKRKIVEVRSVKKKWTKNFYFYCQRSVSFPCCGSFAVRFFFYPLFVSRDDDDTWRILIISLKLTRHADHSIGENRFR